MARLVVHYSAYLAAKNNESNVVTVKHESDIYEFETLDQAMAWAKELGEFVTIQFNGTEVVGKFGADGISDGRFPNGELYTWKKRRRQ